MTGDLGQLLESTGAWSLGWQFRVDGIPAPKGSTRAFIPRGWRRPIITGANAKTKPWEQAVIAAAGGGPWERIKLGPVAVAGEFIFPRPQGHYGARGLKPSAPRFMVQKPDADKLLRAVLDALTGVAYLDDKVVVAALPFKRYALLDETPGAWVEIWTPAEARHG